MLLPPAQKTCCIAAHSASAQVMTTADALGSCPAGVAGSTGAAFPTTAKLTGGNGGAPAIAKAEAAVASCNVMPKRAFGLCLLVIVWTGYGTVAAMKRRPSQRGFHSDERAKSDRYFVELQPPSTTIVWPLMKLPPGEHRKATVLAMSSTVPSRGKGVISTLILRNRSSCKRCSTIGVMVTPGATALQRMPCAPY